MNRKALAILIMSLLALAFCGGSEKQAPPPPTSLYEKNEPVDAPAIPARSSLRVQSLVLKPEAPWVTDDIVAAAELADPELVNVGFQYQWFVNGQEVENVDGERLDRKYFKKGAWIYCRVKAMTEAEETDWFKSDVLRVFNSLPVLQLGPVGEVRVPGDFHYSAAASDPDGDELTFEIVSPLDQGIAIDAKSGALSWKLTEETVQQLGEKIEIKIAVSDGEGEKVTGSITLQFTSTTRRSELP